PVIRGRAMLLHVGHERLADPRDPARVAHRLLEVAVRGVHRFVLQQRQLLMRIGDAFLEPAGRPETQAHDQQHQRRDELTSELTHLSLLAYGLWLMAYAGPEP